MQNRNFKIPAIIMAVGLVLCLVVSLITCVVKVPTVTEHDFAYSATYKLDGETKTLEGIYRSCFKFTGTGVDPAERYYEGQFLGGDEHHIIARQGDLELHVVFIFSSDYLMGDIEPGEAYGDAIYEPYLAVYDQEGCEHQDDEKLAIFGAELISWQTPQPIENTFVFGGFSCLHSASMIAMTVVAALVIVAMLIAVKRDKTVPYKALDKVSIVFNILICVVATPILVFVVAMLALTMAPTSFLYQVLLCLPAFTVLTVAASVALRRMGFTKTGFFIQLIGPSLFVLYAIIESMIYNFFM